MTEAETSYRTSVQQEAEAFAQQLREEVAFHANSLPKLNHFFG